MTTPLPPPWAARVWIEGPTIYVDCPMGDGLPSHRLAFPADAQGMARLCAMLKNRNAHSMLGTKGDLTQHQVNRQLRRPLRADEKVTIQRARIKDTFAPELRAGARAVLRKFGLIGAVQR